MSSKEKSGRSAALAGCTPSAHILFLMCAILASFVVTYTSPGHLIKSYTQKHTSTKNCAARFPPSCGTWPQQYASLHASILAEKRAPRYLVSMDMKTGLADRISGVMSLFFFALLSGRALQIGHQDSVPHFEYAFDFPCIDLGLPFASPVYSNVLRNMHYSKVSQGDLDPRRYWTVDHFNADVHVDLVTDFFVSTNLSTQPAGHPDVPYVIAGSNRGRVFRLFENPYHRTQLQAMGLRPETAAACAFDFLFRPNQPVKDAMQYAYSAMNNVQALKIAISIRVGDRVFENGYTLAMERVQHFFNCAQVEGGKR